MTCAAEYFWYSDVYYHYIGKTNTYGYLMENFDPKDNSIRGLVWDGLDLWTINTSGTLKKYDTSGVLLKTISGLVPGGWGLAFDGTFLWASDPGTDNIYQISLFSDVVPPEAPLITSPTHPQQAVWYSNADPVFNWTPPEDPSGITGYSFLMDASPWTVPDTIIDSTATSVSFTSLVDGPWFFHCRARDGAGNWGQAGHYGIYIDTTPPSKGAIFIAGGADSTTSAVVTLTKLGAVDEGSGLWAGASMKFSNDDLTWSPEEPFAQIRSDWDLSLFGSNGLSGVKRVFVRFKDVAGNWSTSFSDEIVYSAPLSIPTESLVSGTLGFTYADTLSAVGGWPPYQWEVISGALPAGLELADNGIIWGQPEAEGSFDFSVRTTDSNGAVFTGNYSITIMVETSKGDVNGDAIVNVLDLVLTIRYILGQEQLNPLEVWAADVQSDGTINVLDALRIVNIILNTPLARTCPASGLATVWLEETVLSGECSIALRFDGCLSPAAAQISIGLPQGSRLVAPPQSQAFLISHKEENGLMKAVLYTLSESAGCAGGPRTLLTFELSDATAPMWIEHVTMADQNGEAIAVTIKTANAVAPTGWKLCQNHPNPFNPTTAINYQIPMTESQAHTTLNIYNVLGQEVATLVDEVKEAGDYTTTWDGRDASGHLMSSGVYLCRMETGGIAQTIKMILSR